jgi:hypothetical protein
VYAIIDTDIFLMLISLYIFNLGVLPIFYLGFSARHKARFDLFGAVFYSNTPNSGIQFFISIIMVNIGIVFLFGFNWIGIPYLGHKLLVGIGLLAIALHYKFSQEFVDEYRDSKYKMIEGFNNKV